MYLGWYQIAYERELKEDQARVSVGEFQLMLIRSRGRLRAFDAYCPHRGADLTHGKVLDDCTIVCPFHGRHIGLGVLGEDGFAVREYRTLAIGGLIFVLFLDKLDCGLTAFLESLGAIYHFVPGFTVSIQTSPELIVENAFDRRHFFKVHGLDATPELTLAQGLAGEMIVTGHFLTTKPTPWQRQEDHYEERPEFDFCARVFSPTLCVTELGTGRERPIVLTAATPDSNGGCQVRVSVAYPAKPDGSPPDHQAIRALLRDSRTSIEQDKQIWENLSPCRVNNFVGDDDPVVEYYQFCRQFLPEQER